MKRMILSLFVTLALMGTQAFAQCGVQVQWSPVGSGYTEFSQNGCIWTVNLIRTAPTGNVSITVTGINDADLSIWVKTLTPFHQTFINVGGSVRDLRELKKTWDNTGPVIAQTIAVDRHIGPGGGIQVNGVQILIQVGGDVLAPIIIDGEGTIAIKQLERLTVDGDVKATINVKRSQLKELIVTGDLGAPGGSPVTISAGSAGTPGSLSIGTIQARSINANITARQEVRRIETTGGSTGNFKGSLTAVEFRNSSPDAGLFIDNDLHGTLDLTGPLESPIVINGDITVDGWVRTQGNLVHNGVDKFGSIDVGGNVLFMDEQNQGAIVIRSNLWGPITVEGNLDGLIRVLAWVGDPASSLVGSIDVWGNSSGTISADTLIVDKSSVNVGTLSGTLVVDRALRGPVTISQESGLSGQIIANALNEAGRVWDSDVTIGTIVLGPNQSQPDQTPHYERTAAELGGGGISISLISGTPALAIHHESCSPRHNGGTGPTASSAVVQFYGPVKLETKNLMPIKVYEGPVRSTNFDDFTDVTHLILCRGPERWQTT